MNKKYIGIVIMALLIIPMTPAIALNTNSFNKQMSQRPTEPLIDGPIEAEYGENCNYTAVSTDPQGDDLIYVIEFSDAPRSVNEQGPILSGEEIEFSHAWDDFYQETNPYKVRVKAVDEYGHESKWGRFITHVEDDDDVAKNKINKNPKFLRLIDDIFENLNQISDNENNREKLFNFFFQVGK